MFKLNQSKKKLTIKLGPSYILPVIKTNLIINGIILMIVTLVYFFIQPVVPLFFSLAQPTHHLVSKEWLFLLPGLSVLINLTQLQSLRLIDNSQEFVVKLFTYSALVLQVILVMISLRNILVVFKLF